MRTDAVSSSPLSLDGNKTEGSFSDNTNEVLSQNKCKLYEDVLQLVEDAADKDSAKVNFKKCRSEFSKKKFNASFSWCILKADIQKVRDEACASEISVKESRLTCYCYRRCVCGR